MRTKQKNCQYCNEVAPPYSCKCYDTTTKPTHAPTPWAYHLGRGKYPRFHIQTAGGYQIASTPELDSLSKEENAGRERDAAFIVRAVNAHEKLKDLIHSYHKVHDIISDLVERDVLTEEMIPDDYQALLVAMEATAIQGADTTIRDVMREPIAKAEGK